VGVKGSDGTRLAINRQMIVHFSVEWKSVRDKTFCTCRQPRWPVEFVSDRKLCIKLWC
jgi:hypothetical protein